LKKSVLSLALAGLAAPFLFYPQTGFADLEAVTITGNRSVRPTLDRLADVTVIDRAGILNSAATTLVDLLQQQAGLEITQQGGQGKLSGVFLRGTKTAQTLVIVDGIRLENPLSGGANLEFLPLASIERIEIARGPSSSFYGSAAMGGVIQIFTRQGSEIGGVNAYTFGSLAAGSQSTVNASAGVGGKNDFARWLVSISRDQTKGFEATRPSSPSFQADRDAHRQNALNLNVALKLRNASEIGALGFVTLGRTYYDDGSPAGADTRLDFKTSNFAIYAKSQLASRWASEIRIGQSRISYDYYDATGLYPFAPKAATNNLSWSNRITLGDAQVVDKPTAGVIVAGLERTVQDVNGAGVSTGSSPYLETSRRITSGFAGYEIRADAHTLRLQARHDSVQSRGLVASTGANTGTLAYGYTLGGGWNLRASAGSAFRVPTFDDLYNPFGANPNLRPERSLGYELGVEKRQGTSLMKLTAFSQKIRQAIELDSSFVAQNFDSAKIVGATLELREQAGPVSFNAHLTEQNAQGTYTDFNSSTQVTGRLARRAKTHGSVGATWSADGIAKGAKIAGDWQFQSRRTDSNGEALGGYGVFNIKAQLRLNPEPLSTQSPSWIGFAKIGNLLGKRYELASGYNAAPRFFLIGVRYE
jgi:vitamin B12 transporter